MTDQLPNDLISIIVPVYNIEDYLETCIESIINQSYHNLQIILIDDGSTDKSGKICDRFAEKDHRIYVIHKKNGGLVSARNAGLGKANGRYVGFVDGDDYIDCGMYQKLYETAEKYQASFVHSGYYEGEGKISSFTSKELKEYRNIQVKEDILLELFSLHPAAEIGPSLWNNLFERNFITEWYSKVPVSQAYGEDLMIMCYCIIKASIFVSIPDAYYHYRYRENSLSKDMSEEQLLKYYTLYERVKEILLDNGYGVVVLDALKKRFGILGMQLLAELNHYYIPKYKYPQMDDLYGKRIVLYGAGRVGIDYYCEICKYQDCHIVSWADRRKRQLEYAVVENAESIQFKEYDIVLIAVLSGDMANEIKKQLLADGIDKEKIIWKEPAIILD